MDLKNFVSQILIQFVEGVADAQRHITALNTGASINPVDLPSSASRKIAPPSPVEFDVAVAVQESAVINDPASKEFKISVLTLKDFEKNETSFGSKIDGASRIKFSVNVSQPSDVSTYLDPNRNHIF